MKKLISRLPDLSECLVVFFTSALQTWTRFMAEFALGSVIDLSTVKEHELAWMPPTNDANEGILVECSGDVPLQRDSSFYGCST